MEAVSAPILSALALAAGLGLASAQGGGHHDHAAHGAGSPSGDTPATRAFREAETRMHRDMALDYTNDVDADFLRGMIPHHEGAVAMARIALHYSKDPAVRKLAETIVRTQEAEIGEMRELLKRK